MDIPMFFYALEHRPSIKCDLIKAVAPTAPVRTDQIFYKVNKYNIFSLLVMSGSYDIYLFLVMSINTTFFAFSYVNKYNIFLF